MQAESARSFTRRVIGLRGNIDFVLIMVLSSEQEETVMKAETPMCQCQWSLDRGKQKERAVNIWIQQDCTHHERVLHSDNAAVQDGGWDGGDLQHLAAPGLRFARGQRLSPQVGHQLLDLLHLPFGIEGLGLVDGCLWHHHAGRAVFNLGKDLDRLSYRVRDGRGEVKLSFIQVCDY